MKQIFHLAPYYRIEVTKTKKKIQIFSDSKHAKGRELKQYKNANGYLSVKLNNKTIPIHTLIAKFYMGDRSEGLCVNHKDGNKLNNMPDNLEYVTIAENILHSIKYGMHICNRPELMPTYKDGRTKNKAEYKRKWYLENRERILLKTKIRYNERIQSATN